MFKGTLKVLFGIVLVTQLAGCFYGGHDDRWHHDHDHDHGPVVVLHG